MQKLIIVVWLLAFFFCRTGDNFAQTDIQIKSWGQAHGIESAVIFGVFRDQNNLIWICTYNGLFYFDGFRAYKSPIVEADGKTTFNGIVNQLVQSEDGRYWLKLDYTMGAYDIYTKVFTPLKTQPSNLLSTFSSIGDQLFVFDPARTYLVDKKSFELIPMVFVDDLDSIISDDIRPSGLPTRYFSFFKESPVEVVPSKNIGKYVLKRDVDSSKTFWNQKGYFRLNIDAKGNTWYRHPLNYRELIVEDSLGRDISDEILRLFEGVAIHFFYTLSDYSWFVTDNGLMLWEKNAVKPENRFEKFPELSEVQLSQSFDRGKTIWFWNKQGLFNLRTNPSQFSSITKENLGLYSNFILGIFPFDENRLIIKHDFSDQYYSFFDLRTGEVRPVYLDDIFRDFGLIEYRDILKNGDPKTWILKNGRNIHEFFAGNPNINPFTRTFISDGKSYDYFIYPGDQFDLVYQLWRISENKMVFPRIIPLQYLQQGDTVWIGTESEGLVALHTPSGQTQQWLSDLGKPESIPSNRVHAVIPVADDNLWLGTGNGLSFFNKKTGKFTTYRTQEGLVDNKIYCMAFDRKGHLWIGTGNGLSRFDTLNKSFTNFTKADGLVNSEYNRNSAMLLPDGRMMMGGMGGIDLFDPDEVGETIEKPKPMVAHVHNNDKLINLKSQFDFRHIENHFDFYVSAIPIWMASTLSYEYRLVGAESDWQSLNFSNVVHYPNLPPGDYSFQVRIANQPEIASYDFVIHQVWYASWWFRLAFILVGLFLIYFIYRMMLSRRILRLQQENRIMQLKAEQAKSVTKERERIIADLHDDVGATLSSLHIYGDLAGKVWESQPEKGKEMVDKIRDQSKELMGRMSDIVWSMKDPKNEKYSLRSRIRNYANELLSSKEILFADVLASDLDEKIVQPELRRNLLLVVKEAMNNIAKHSQASRVRLVLYEKEGQLILKINDNGQGLDVMKVQNGNGLGNMQKRCQQMNGKLTVESQKGNGTTLICAIPMATISIVDGDKSP
ncbi:histidine kinase [Aquiflexum sp. TKW24L]|uniref:sensor histidine kinase n=1 Tax=Aquiflexum sp. TKW24L TaxID=2942212 RepID=UPI0020BDA620|nr:sensor histidine kinase [Aquiflexum sp. TKW24L]MCL6261708.1 histidine kinase [Aquiflexum sp. TKW24L]